MLLVLGLTSCGDNGDCTQADFVGTWVGTEECTLDSSSDAVTIVIIAQGSNIEIDGGSFVTDELELDGCTASEETGAFGTGFEYRASLSGDDLTLTHIVKAASINTNVCTYTLTRQ